MTPSLMSLGEACAFRERCTRAMDSCGVAPAVRAVGAARTLRCCNPAP
jgi:peptide/nickel transport system ATP-binding protein